jgi:hypothetical protein
MSQIAAILLMYMDEEDAFWCLHALLIKRQYTMHGILLFKFNFNTILLIITGFFVPGFPKLQRFQNHYEKVLLKYVPRVKKHLVFTLQII